MKKIVILIIGLLITHAVVAQITVDAKIDSVAILIGQQARMTASQSVFPAQRCAGQSFSMG